jgi:hypothetical protein
MMRAHGATGVTRARSRTGRLPCQLASADRDRANDQGRAASSHGTTLRTPPHRGACTVRRGSAEPGTERVHVRANGVGGESCCSSIPPTWRCQGGDASRTPHTRARPGSRRHPSPLVEHPVSLYRPAGRLEIPRNGESGARRQQVGARAAVVRRRAAPSSRWLGPVRQYRGCPIRGQKCAETRCPQASWWTETAPASGPRLRANQLADTP